jgi:hypothetical protein
MPGEGFGTLESGQTRASAMSNQSQIIRHWAAVPYPFSKKLFRRMPGGG